ncbi:MAG: tryptophan-rich sensory protein [Bacteroidales bacterium]|nr:tryptophan-rich sensory protein [Bacteroidales bacterium]
MIRYINVVLFAGMLVMNYLANALPLNGKTTGELSDSFPNLFVPAGLTFSIWGVIYILILLYVIFQFKDSNALAVSQVSLAFGISCILNALWIVFWHYGRLPLSLLVMAGLLASLIYINIAIRDLPFGIIKASFGIYLGWICIATIANVTAVLVTTGWNGFNISQEAWTIIMIAVGTLLVAATIYRLKNPFLGLAVVWAFLGIAIKRQDDYRTILITTIVAIVIISGVTIWGFMRKSIV